MVKSNKRSRKSTGMILVDIEKAFDSICHNGLISNLNIFGFALYLIKISNSFLTDRVFKIIINDTLSTIRKIPVGVPQGAVLSPKLYSIYISDFNNTSHNISIQRKDSHINKNVDKTVQTSRALYPLQCRRSFLNLKNKILIYKTIIRTQMLYGCSVWKSAANTHLQKIQIIQNKNLKIIHKLPRKYSTFLSHSRFNHQKLS